MKKTNENISNSYKAILDDLDYYSDRDSYSYSDIYSDNKWGDEGLYARYLAALLPHIRDQMDHDVSDLDRREQELAEWEAKLRKVDEDLRNREKLLALSPDERIQAALAKEAEVADTRKKALAAVARKARKCHDAEQQAKKEYKANMLALKNQRLEITKQEEASAIAIAEQKAEAEAELRHIQHRVQRQLDAVAAEGDRLRAMRHDLADREAAVAAREMIVGATEGEISSVQSLSGQLRVRTIEL